MNYANENRPSTESQMRLILNLAHVREPSELPTIPDAPYRCRTLTDRELSGDITARTAAQLIETLRVWNLTHP